MNKLVSEEKTIKGGEFLVQPSTGNTTFIPEEFSEEQKMIKDSVSQFIDQEITPNVEKIEKQENNIAADLMEKFGELGFLGTHMPENLGGLDMDFNTNTIIGEEIGRSGSFSVAYNAHTGIGMLPILYFGTEEQKQKYLPKLATGEWKASYCLTEPSSGSDALSAKTKAELTDDGKHYILNGQKMWISNAGFADVFIVFAQAEGNQFTGFIVEKGTEGLSLGEEEKKLGIKGSSTRMVFLENAKIPVENLLGEVGKGHKIAFNVLNTGRFKLGASVVGGAKSVNAIAIRYANERHQFQQPISNFGAIKHKIGEAAIQTFATESVLYRISHLINQEIINLKERGVSYADAKLKAAEEYAIECSIIKILGSEVLDYCVDEAVQIHGGMGYSEEGTVARAYRDSRINRIFEGTNEINRMVIINTLLKKAMKGEIDIVNPALAVQNELQKGTEENVGTDGEFTTEHQAIANYKKIMLMLLGSAAQLAMGGKLDLKEEQELLINLADIFTDIFVCESTLLRVEKARNHRMAKNSELHEAILKTLFYDINSRIYKNGLDAVANFVREDKQGDYIAGLRKFTKYPIINGKKNRRLIAEKLISDNTYSL